MALEDHIFEVSDETVDAVNAVEGIYLSAESKARLAKLEASNLTAAEQREVVRQAYREKTAK